ncbi:hypothetical protein [Lyngbya sp. PCC 8106]|uniref:hypothetical protein n=1 Tax=Lyngbya sp. (strain PCC 8106) TaxID=313612 RepID=UPI001E36BD66|nr:hypothetical protein [Lyngbya sp. PCC 8106]
MTTIKSGLLLKLEVHWILKFMAFIEYFSIAGLGVLVGLLIFRVGGNQDQNRRLDNAFYQLLDIQDSRISLIQLAATAQVSAEVAQDYLERQARVFSALPDIDDEGNTFYQFPRLNLPKKMKQQEW